MIHADFPPAISIGADIRVLKLKYSNNSLSSLIACEFRDITIGGNIPYTAVSYVWGNDDCLHSILVNDRSVEVRNNLWQFLRQMNRESNTSYLWIDALCINQNDVEERSSQVAIMGQIYSAAADVLVWLGNDAPVSEGKRVLESVSLCFPEHNGFFSVKRDRRTHEFAQDLLRQLRENTYWSRVWVTQEFILAKKLELRCGPDSMQGDVLLELHERVVGSEFSDIYQLRKRDIGMWDYQPSLRPPNMYKLIQLRRQWQNRTTPYPLLWHRVGLFSFLGLPTPPPNTQCSDPRDKIYSLLSLADAEEFAQNPLYPDYTRSANSLLFDLVDRDSRKVQKEFAPSSKNRNGGEHQALRDLRTRALKLAQMLEIESPEVASSYAVKKALVNQRATSKAGYLWWK